MPQTALICPVVDAGRGGEDDLVTRDEDQDVEHLRRKGFVPIEELTGEIEFAHVSPDAHRRAVRDTRYEPEPTDFAIPGLTDGTQYLVRSPWASTDTTEAVMLLQRWGETAPSGPFLGRLGRGR
jgi:hypothetical protein